MFIDTHAHLDMRDFSKDRQEVLRRARRGGVQAIITVGIDLSSSQKAIDIAHSNDTLFATVGYHPHHARESDPDSLERLCQWVSDPKVVAWGEIGLDFYRCYSPPEIQVEVFQQQLALAAHYALPVIIHDRDAHEEVFQSLKKMNGGKRKGVVHCFSGTYDLAMAFIEMGYYISIPGTVTYEKARIVHEVAARIPLERMLIETDAPYLAPVPKRGKRNEPLYVTFTAQRIADLRGMAVGDIGRRTSLNAIKLFRLPIPIDENKILSED